jgi:hypothetical protein
MSRFDYDFIDSNPHPGDDPVARLRHTLDRYPEVDDDREVLSATRGMYPQGDTGLTFGDLRAIARLIGA